MYPKYFILVLCLFLLGGSLEAKNDQDPNDWTVSNTMSREDHEHHVAVRPSETIDIDERPPQGGFYSGDGSDMSDDDGSSGMGWDDEDDTEEGSAVLLQTKCLREYEMKSRNTMPGAPPAPRCTQEGEYEKKQCHGSTGQCWCVEKDGLEIGGTRRGPGYMLDCDNVVPVFPEAVPTPKQRNPAEAGYDDNDEITTSEEEEDLKNSIDTMPQNPDATVDIKKPEETDFEKNHIIPEQHQQGHGDPETLQHHALLQPGLLAGIIGGAVVGLLCAVLLVMFIVYRMRKKDEGSYALDEPKRSPSLHTYARATNREFYA